MTEKQNILEVLNHTGKAEWLPVGNDSMYFIHSSGDGDRPYGKQEGYDWFGCYWIYDAPTEGYVMPPASKYPYVISDICEWESQVKFPDLDAIDWESLAEKDLAELNREEKIIQIKTESGAFERLHQMMGFEEAFIAMYEEPEAFADAMEAISDFRILFYDKLITYYHPEALFMMDDLGSQNAPLMSLDIYRELIKPYDKKIIDFIHSKDTKVVYHSCGCMQDFIGDLIEIGIDLVNPLQGGINDQVRVQKEYGDQIGVTGALDNLVHLPSTPEEKLREEMRRIMDIFWEKKNLIITPRSYAPGHSEILLDEARRYNAEKMGA